MSNTPDKLQLILDLIQEMHVDIALLKNDVAHHIRRTDLAEESIRLIRAEVQPIKDHVTRVDGGLKLIGFIGLFVGIVGGIYKIFVG